MVVVVDFTLHYTLVVVVVVSFRPHSYVSRRAFDLEVVGRLTSIFGSRSSREDTMPIDGRRAAAGPNSHFLATAGKRKRRVDPKF